jgi:hypothetical protein
MVEFCETPVDQAQLNNISILSPDESLQTCLAFLMINHDIVRLHVSMHDPLAMTEIECLDKISTTRPQMHLESIPSAAHKCNI